MKKLIVAFMAVVIAFTSMITSGQAAQLTIPFTDVPDRYKTAVSYLYDKGFIKGINSNQFGTQRPLKRADAAMIIAHSINAIESYPTLEKLSFTDVPSRAILAVNALQKAGILSGRTKTSFAPSATLTRGEAALILSKAYQLPPSTKTMPFTDVPTRYKVAVKRLVASGVTKGKSSTHFGIQDSLTRGELSLMLYQLENLKEDQQNQELIETLGYIISNDDREIWIISDVQKEDILGKLKEELLKEYQFKGVRFDLEDINSKIVSKLQLGQKVKITHDRTFEGSAPAKGKAIQLEIIEK